MRYRTFEINLNGNIWFERHLGTCIHSWDFVSLVIIHSWDIVVILWYLHSWKIIIGLQRFIGLVSINWAITNCIAKSISKNW